MNVIHRVQDHAYVDKWIIVVNYYVWLNYSSCRRLVKLGMYGEYIWKFKDGSEKIESFGTYKKCPVKLGMDVNKFRSLGMSEGKLKV